MYQTMFQFLIGKLITTIDGSSWDRTRLQFQFLIGKLITRGFDAA